MVWVDPVTIGDVEVVADLDGVDQNVLAIQHMQTPVGRVLHGQVADDEVFTRDERKHAWPEWLGLPTHVSLRVAGHELHRLAVERAGAGDRQPLGMFGCEQAGGHCIIKRRICGG
jgi:hypothetical protein